MIHGGLEDPSSASGVSSSSLGAFLSIKTFPAMSLIWSRWASSKRASTDCGCTVAKTRTVVVPFLSSSSKKILAVLAAYFLSLNLDSAGKVYLLSYSISCSP